MTDITCGEPSPPGRHNDRKVLISLCNFCFCCHRTGSGVTIPYIRTSDKAGCLWQQRAKKGLAFTEKRDNLQSVLGILNSKEDMEADSNQ